MHLQAFHPGSLSHRHRKADLLLPRILPCEKNPNLGTEGNNLEPGSSYFYLQYPGGCYICQNPKGMFKWSEEASCFLSCKFALHCIVTSTLAFVLPQTFSTSSAIFICLAAKGRLIELLASSAKKSQRFLVENSSPHPSHTHKQPFDCSGQPGLNLLSRERDPQPASTDFSCIIAKVQINLTALPHPCHCLLGVGGTRNRRVTAQDSRANALQRVKETWESPLSYCRYLS